MAETQRGDMRESWGSVLSWTPRLALLAMVPTVALHGVDAGRDPPSVEEIAGLVSLRIWLLIGVAVAAAWARGPGLGDARSSVIAAGRFGSVLPGVDHRMLLGALVVGSAVAFVVGLPDLALRSVLDSARDNAPAWRPPRLLIPILLLVVLTRLTARWSRRVEALFGMLTLGYWALLLWHAATLIGGSPSVIGVLDPRVACSWAAHHGGDTFAMLVPATLVLIGLEGWIRATDAMGGRRRWRVGLPLAVLAVVMTELGQVAARAGTPTSRVTSLLQDTLLGSPLLGPTLALAAIVLAGRHLLQRTTRPLREAAQLGYLPRLDFVRRVGIDGESFHLPVLFLPLLLLQLALWWWSPHPATLMAAVALPLTAAWIGNALLGLLRDREAGRASAARGGLSALTVVVGVPALAAALAALHAGAWLSLVLPIAGAIVVHSWQRGRERLLASTHSTTLPLASFCESIRSHPPRRIGHTAIVLTSRPESVPPVLLANLGFNQVLFARVILLTVDTVNQPRVDDAARLDLDPVGEGFYRARLRFGVEEETDVPAALERLVPDELAKPIRSAVYLVGHEVVVADEDRWWRAWQDRLFAVLVRNAQPAHEHFRLPPNRRIEIGTRWSA